jgi:putative ABC transport system permease protein
MLINYLKIAVRNLLSNKIYSLINILGLAIGMAACICILLFLQKELSFEKMHLDADRIYRVLTIDKALGTHNQRVGITMPPLAQAAPVSVPEIEASLRLTGGSKLILRYGDRLAVSAEKVRYSDENFFDFFSFRLSQGDPATALKEPYSIVLTRSLAQSLFGDENPLGQILKTGDGNDIKVTGVLEDPPDNTHLQFNALGSISTLIAQARKNQPPNSKNPIWLESWGWVAMPTYIRLAKDVSLEGLPSKLTQLCRDNGVEVNFDITLQPVQDIHLYSTDIIFDPVTNKGDIKNIYIFIAIGFLILIIATVNYINLSTARSTQRAKEVGLRKVVGSLRSQLILQFISESFLITLIALILSIPLAQLALPWLNQLLQSKITLNFIENSYLLPFLFIMLILVGILAGLYPALVLSNFKPVTVLKGSFKSSKSGTTLRRTLVVFQFTLSIALIGLTAIIQRQMHFIQNKDLGYDREQVLVLDMYDQEMTRKLNTLREELSKHSSFVAVATSGNVPGRTFGRTGIRPEGASDEDIWIWSQLSVSPETLPALGMQIVEGRNFSRERGSDTSGVVLINQTAVSQLGWENPLDKRLYFGEDDSVGVQVIGIVKDFHFIGMHQPIEPVVIFPLTGFSGNMLVARIEKGRIAEALAYTEQKWQEIYPQYPFPFKFLDDEFNNLYRRDINTSTIINVFSLLSIFIACLGLVSLSSHSTLLRIKEIGVRKVMGASTRSIIIMLVIDFIRWVALASLFAWPLAWYAASQWLSGFAYRVKIEPLLFIIASIIGLIIAVVSVLSVSWRAATINPSRALRYE